jgi:hypothetical protein
MPIPVRNDRVLIIGTSPYPETGVVAMIKS